MTPIQFFEMLNDAAAKLGKSPVNRIVHEHAGTFDPRVVPLESYEAIASAIQKACKAKQKQTPRSFDSIRANAFARRAGVAP